MYACADMYAGRAPRLQELQLAQGADRGFGWRTHIPQKTLAESVRGIACRELANVMYACLCVQRPKAAASAEETEEEVQSSEVAEVQAAVELVQKQMRVYDGSFLQFRCDEKGFLSICAFGLPGKTHEDSPTRAIQACCAVQLFNQLFAACT